MDGTSTLSCFTVKGLGAGARKKMTAAERHVTGHCQLDQYPLFTQTGKKIYMKRDECLTVKNIIQNGLHSHSTNPFKEWPLLFTVFNTQLAAGTEIGEMSCAYAFVLQSHSAAIINNVWLFRYTKPTKAIRVV